MSILIITFAVAYFVQLMVISQTEKKLLRRLPLIIMELPILGGAAWYALTKPFLWEANVAILLYMAAAAFAGWFCARFVVKFSAKQAQTQTFHKFSSKEVEDDERPPSL